MRMLMNNLHPDVAENPNELVVYGGVGRAARTWGDFDRIVATLKRLDEDETLLVQSGKPVGVFRTHPDAPRVLIANSNLGAALGDLGPLQRARPQGPRHVRPDDGGVVDLHRQPGDRAGNVRDLRGSRPQALRRRPRGALDPDRGARGHGRSPAARGGDGGGLLPGGGMRPRPHRLPASHPLPGREGRLARRGAGDDRGLDGLARGEVCRGPRQRGRHLPRARTPRRPSRRRHRPDLGPRPRQRLPAVGLDARRVEREARERPVRGGGGGSRIDPHPRRGHGRLREPRGADHRLRQQHPAGCERRGARRRLLLPRFRPGVHPARCSAAASDRSAGARCPATRRTSSGPTRR